MATATSARALQEAHGVLGQRLAACLFLAPQAAPLRDLLEQAMAQAAELAAARPAPPDALRALAALWKRRQLLALVLRQLAAHARGPAAEAYAGLALALGA